MTLPDVGVLAGLALLDSTSTGTLTIPVVMLLQPRVRFSRVLGYLTAISLFYWGLGLALATVGARITASPGLRDALESRTAYAVQLVIGVALVAFLVTLLVGLIVLRATGSSLGGFALGWGRASDTGTASAPAPLVPDASGFNAARIIDDEVFYDSQAMTREEIAAFVTKVNAGCQPGSDGTECLAGATFSVPARQASTFCPGGIEAASGASAADVIWEVSQACDINPQVLLVLIHKEQGLLTASGASLSARDYEAAAGYACPDHGACDPQWAGFPSQLYGAASQFHRYRLDPGSYDVVAQRPTRIAYSPDGQCGSGEVTVANQATAGLYNYTPFQPNEAAAHGGDQCTSWGNWNFYGYFKTLFGAPTSA